MDIRGRHPWKLLSSLLGKLKSREQRDRAKSSTLTARVPGDAGKVWERHFIYKEKPAAVGRLQWFFGVTHSRGSCSVSLVPRGSWDLGWTSMRSKWFSQSSHHQDAACCFAPSFFQGSLPWTPWSVIISSTTYIEHMLVCYHAFRTLSPGAREMAQWLTTLATLPEDRSSIPSTYMAATTPSSGLWVLGTHSTDLHVDKTPIQINTKKMKQKSYLAVHLFIYLVSHKVDTKYNLKYPL